MKNIIRFLKGSEKAVILIVLLLVMQAYCDLALPNYTSDLLNVGLQQNGIENAAPKTIRAETLSSLELFTADDDVSVLENAYSNPDEDGIRTLNADADADRISELMMLPESVFYQMKNTEASSGISVTDIEAAIKAGLMTKEQFLAGIREQIESYGDLSDTYLKQIAVSFVASEYEAQGVELSGIRVGGKSVTEYARGELRRNFGMVLQDTWLFHGTIMDNIRYGRLDASDEEVIAAAKAARADYFIRALPGGYKMELNEESSNVSQGQKQLLTIARALLADNPILILDEATSSVDTRTEHLIQAAMEELMKGRTSFVIAHRLSTIRNADIILVMRDGDIVEQGDHESLMAQNGFYAELYNSQFAMI